MKTTIDLDHKIEYKGYWFLPNDPGNAVAGILTYYPNEKILLELIGCFGEVSFELFNKSVTEDIIYGKTDDAKEITLLQSFRSLQLNFDAEFPIVRYTSSCMIIGKFINSLDEKCQYSLIASIPELSLWCQPNALHSLMRFDKKGNSNRIELSFSTGFQSKETTIDSTAIDSNTTIKIKQGVFYDGDYLEPKIRQHSYLEICKKKKCSLRELFSNLFMYEQFLSLATLSIVKCSKIMLKDKKLFQQIENAKFYREIYVIRPFSERKNLQSIKSKSFKFLFDYSTIKNSYSSVLQKWYNEPEELAPIRFHLIGSLEKRQVHSSIDFIVLIQALEGFYRRFRNRKYRKKHNMPDENYSKLFPMLESLINEFSDIDLIKQCNINIDAVVDSRIYFSHFMPKSPNSKAIDGWELYEQTIRIRILLICCVLSLFGFTNKQINEIFTKSDSDVLKLK